MRTLQLSICLIALIAAVLPGRLNAATNQVVKAGAVVKTVNDADRCWACTKSGNRCKRRAVAGERYCRQHSADVNPKIAPATCRAMTEAGKQCDKKPEPGKCYCKEHLR